MRWEWHQRRKQLIMNHRLKMILEGYITGVSNPILNFSGFFSSLSAYMFIFIFSVVSYLCSVMTCNHPHPHQFFSPFCFTSVKRYWLLMKEVIVISRKILSTEFQLIIGLQWVVMEWIFDNSNYLYVLVFLNLLCRNDAE